MVPNVEQQFNLTVSVLTTPNHPPSIVSDPVYGAEVGNSYSYQVVATDEDGDEIGYSLIQSPSGMVIDSETGEIVWVPTEEYLGNHQVIVQAGDDVNSYAQQSYSLNVTSNAAPTIVSVPSLVGMSGTEYTYSVIAIDPDGDSLVYSLEQAPEGMSIADNEISWTPSSDQPGVSSVAVSVVDSEGLASSQIFNIQIAAAPGPNRPPVVNSESLPPVARVGELYEASLPVVDSDGDSLQFELDAGAPAGVTIDSEGVLRWTPEQDQVGTHIFSVLIDDGNFELTYEAALVVDSGLLPLDVQLSVVPQFALPDQPINLSVQVEGGEGPLVVEATVNGTLTTLVNNEANLSRNEIGRYEVIAEVEDSATGEIITTATYFTVADEEDYTAPTVTLESPVDGAEITSPVDVVATLYDDNLASYTLFIQKAGSAESIILAEGASNISSGVLGSFDPTLLINGQYDLFLEATDSSGQSSITGLSLNVEGDLKVGNFSFTVEDLEIPMSGVPIRVTRTYDSRRRHENLDFGYGWSIDYQNITVEESRTPGQFWSLNRYGYGPFNALARFCVEPQGAPVVTVTLPDGDQEKFEFAASPQCFDGSPQLDVNLVFNPVGDTQSTLQVLGNSTARLSGNTLVNTGDFINPVDPSRYRLTTKAGYIYDLDQDFGIETVTTPNGHTLSYTDNGIFHSDGKSVLFNRDDEGRIQSITDPSGNERSYTYNSRGDLVIAADQVNAATSYTYNRSHGLLDVIDPLGRTVVKNLYDDDGRLIAQEDSDGNRTDFDHDIAGRHSIVTDRLGNITQYYYNDRGDVTTQIDALGHTRTFTYDARGNQLSETDPLGNAQSATFNDRNDQLTQTDGLGNTVSFVYNTRGQETQITDALGNVYNNVYDSVGNLLQITDPLDNVAGNQINSRGLVTRTTDLLGNSTDYTYDGEGNKLTETDAEGGLTTYTYDDNNNVLTEASTRTVGESTVTDTTQYTYDDRDRVTSTTDPLGYTTHSEYDLVGNEVATVDALGRRTEMTYDVYGNLLSTTYPDGTTETHSYDAENNRISTTDRRGLLTQFGFDALNRQVSMTYPDGSTTTTEYDAAGRVSAEIDTLGNRTEYEYDAANLEIVNDYMGGAFISYLILNPNTNELLFADGFLHAPGKDKRDFMEHLNYILNTIKF